MDLKTLTIKEASRKLKGGEISSVELSRQYLKRIKSLNPVINAYITVDEDYTLRMAEKADEVLSSSDSFLTGVPASTKDLFCTEGVLTTAASNILSNFVPAFESSVTTRLLRYNYVMLGKTNLDQFAHGSSNETSYYGFCHNPWDLTRIPGGSSGGAAASVAAGLCVYALGTETAGSIRNPASMCGVVGFKPTYGRVPRFGVVAMGSSLDCPGPITRTVEDAAIVMDVIAGQDSKDMTTFSGQKDFFKNLDHTELKNLKIGIPGEYLNIEGISEGTRKVFEDNVELIKKLGAQVLEVSILDPEISNWVYTIICRAEISSNLARYDGSQYGYRSSKTTGWHQTYLNTRGEGFGVEAKRRIMTGTAVLSKGYEDRLYKKAASIRSVLAQDFERVFREVDLLLAPVAPSCAIKLGTAEANPLFGELMDIFNTANALCGLPAICVPGGFEQVTDNGKTIDMPAGVQFIGPKLSEQRLLNAGFALEKERGGFENNLKYLQI
jgi:aspartyl-tRNA(Asn)/glutamyl-tRNA(Gln) amidotransferase subunit A